MSCSYRRKAEELLWKKVFYDLIQKSKSNRQVHVTCTGCNVLVAKRIHVHVCAMHHVHVCRLMYMP